MSEFVQAHPWVVILIAAIAGFAMGALLLRRRGSVQLKATHELEEKLNALKEACQLSQDALLVVDRSRQILFANQAAYKLTNIPLREPLSRLDASIKLYSSEEKKEVSFEQLLQQHRLHSGKEKTVYREIRIGKERELSARVEIRSYRPPTGRQVYDILLVHDQTCEQKLLRQHHLNPFSGLPNQFQAFGDISRLSARQSHSSQFAVLMMELDNASYLRSMLGYAEMDDIITMIANTLRELQKSQSGILVYHFNYVTFMLLIKGSRDPDEIQALFLNLQREVQRSYDVRGKAQGLSFSGGVSLYPKHGTLHNLLNNAYSALAKAQEQGHGQLVSAGEKHEIRTDQELHLNNEIAQGLKGDEFKLYFQPIYDSEGKSLVGAEVLLRWHHAERGIVMPDIFIPVAERSGLIIEVGRYVIGEALRHLSSWNSFGFPPLRLTVNLSLRELEYPDFLPNLVALLEKYEIGESRLQFEITEHTSMLNPELTQTRFQEIRQLGISIALDDFGSGYSSFAHLAEFPIETLKIDRSFVTDITRHPSNQHIVSTMIKLGHALGMTIVAEGVESKEDTVMLHSMGADYLQGYYFSRPIPKLEFQYLLSHPEH